MSLCLRMEDAGGKEGRTKTSWISGRTLLLYSVICRNCLKGMALAIHLLRADGKIFGVQACQKLPSQEKCPKQNRHKKWRLGCFPQPTEHPRVVLLCCCSLADIVLYICIPFARSYQGYGRPGRHHIFSLLFRWIRITSTIWLLTLLIRWIRITLTATTNPNPTQLFHFHQVSTTKYQFASSQ